jgi:ProP effector
MTSDNVPDDPGKRKADEYRATAHAVIALLAERFARTFAVYERRRRPLKLGIHHDIAALLNGAVSDDELSIGLGYYTGNVCYLRACVQDAARIDLDGNAAGTVSAEHADQAVKRLAARRPRAKSVAPTSPTAAKSKGPPRLGLAELRAAGRARKLQEQNV